MVHNNQISFYVNGKLQIIKDEYPLTTSLSYYLRDVLKLTGTKVYCHEGGCGACVVHATELDHVTNKHRDISINSCLFPLYSCDGYSFTTVEGIGSKKTGLHPIQQRLADCNGTQCGYCTPGFVMSMYSKLKQNSKPTKDEIEKSFDGNICRCTGYRAILDAMQSFSVDEKPIDIEDLTNIKCLNENKSSCCDNLSNEIYRIVKDNKEWILPQNLNNLKTLLKTNENLSYRFVSGNTSIGIFKKQGPFDAYIDIKNIKELHNVEKTSNKLKVGSCISLTKLRDILKETSNSDPANFGHFNDLSDNLLKIGNFHVRNRASWAGNLAMKKEHLEFPSDVLIILATAGASLNILDLNTNLTYQLSLGDFLSNENLKPNKYFIESLTLPAFDQEKVKMKYFKIMPRSQNAHAYVNCGFRFTFESNNSTKLATRPLIVFNGLSDKFFNAFKTEEFLQDKDINDNSIFLKSIEILTNELNSSGIHEINDALLTSPKYRVNLALSLYYKFILSLKSNIPIELKSAIESIIDTRNVSTGERVFDSDKSLYPLTKPSSKMNAYAQTTGEVKYIDDLSPLSHQAHAAFILSTVASAKIESIEVEMALKEPGVIAIYFAKDIPGENNLMPPPFSVEPVFADKEVIYCGQPIGLVVAETRDIAKKAVKMVKINYSDVKKPIINIQDAIKANSFHPKPICGDLVKGDAETAIKSSKHQLSGEFFFDCSQYHFFLEGLISICEPVDDGYKIECTTQWIDSVQRSVTMVLGLDNCSSVDVQVKQLGGGFGGKITRGNIPATASAIAAHNLARPVKVHMDLNDCMNMIGSRPTWYVKYNVGFDDNGKIDGAVYEWYSDPGFSPNGSYLFYAIHFFESAYNIPNMFVKTNHVKTNKPACTEVRSPDVLPAISATEQVLEHVANYLNKDPLEVREVNFFKKGDKTAHNHTLPNIEIDKVVNQIKESSEFYKRKQKVDEFNRVNKYKKKGIALVPLRYSHSYNFGFYNALISVKHHDGSVSVSHGGIEMGQGIHTKVAQACAYELGIPFEKVSIKSTNNLVNPNCFWTGASVTSELCCASVVGACKKLKESLEPIKKTLPENHTWQELITKAHSMHHSLTAMYFQRPEENFTDLMTYDNDAASCSEVLIDILTGEVQVLRTDILYDCGRSINGLIDVGQAEGGFIMGLGYMLLEKQIYDPETGNCLNNGTWEYKPPLARDIPVDLRIKFLEDKPNPFGVLGSKAVGEPPMHLSNSILYAVRNAIDSARKDRGVNGHFRFDLPATIDNVHQACLVEPNEFKLN